MSQSLIDLHILTAKAAISHEKYIAGIITTEEFLKEIESIDCHCHTDIKLEEAHSELDCCYRDIMDGILRLYHQENKK
jgi:hypothetical protein